MFLGIEIGGSKLQLGVGAGDGSPLAELVRLDVDRSAGAVGILAQIEATAPERIRRHKAAAIGIGFGGPVDAAAGRAVKSHQVQGWDNFPLVRWCADKLHLPAVVGNDCDVAALAEARFGAGQGKRIVFYVTVGTGIGGGLVVDGRLYTGSGGAAAEIGHLRPGLAAETPDDTVESIASGPGIARRAASRGGTPRTAEAVADAAARGDQSARRVLDEATRTLGWAIAQTITLVAPQVIILGGGVSHIRQELFLDPVRRAAAGYVFPPLAGTYEIVHARLGDAVVVHGALALAADEDRGARSEG